MADGSGRPGEQSVSDKLRDILSRREQEGDDEEEDAYVLPFPKNGGDVPRAPTAAFPKSAGGGHGGSLLAARREPEQDAPVTQDAQLPFPVGHTGTAPVTGEPAAPTDFSQFVTSWLYGDGDQQQSQGAPAQTAADDGNGGDFEHALNHFITADPEAGAEGTHLPGSVPGASPGKAHKGVLKHKTGPESDMGVKAVTMLDGGTMRKDQEDEKKKKPVPASYVIHFPSLNTGQWEDVVHSVMWRVGRYFGFQAFNLNPKTRNNMYGEWVPSTIYCASDHLINLLVRNAYIRREIGADKPEERFAKAVYHFHQIQFSNYYDWCKLVNLPVRMSAAEHVLSHYSYQDSKVMNGLLSELALYFCVYTEVSSMRHCPELILFVYWTMNNSYIMHEMWQRDLPEHIPGLRNRQVDLRNLHQQVIRDVQNHLQLHPKRMRPEDCGRLASIAARLKDSLVPPEDCAMVSDLVAFGDGGFFCDRVITPMFYVFSYEVDHLSNLNIDVAHRLGYDDFNESVCDKNIVFDTLMKLRVRPEQLAKAEPNEAYTTMTNLGFERGSVGGFDPQVASDFWRTKVFVKTYRERRTWAAMYRGYYRVYTFHFVLYHLLQTFCFAGWDWRFLSSSILTLAWCKALERISNWFMTREPKEPLSTTLGKVFSTKRKVKLNHTANLRAHMAYGEKAEHTGGKNVYALAAERFMERRPHVIEGTPIWGIFGVIEWILIAVIATVWYVAMWIPWKYKKLLFDNWWMFAVSYVGIHVFHFLLTTKPGYQISLTQALNLPAYFRANSTIPDVTCWQYKPMKTKGTHFALNVLFWGLVLAMKVPFDYVIICNPVVEPILLIWQRHWLSCADPDWTVGYWGAPCPGGDWLLAVSRISPFVIIFFMDTSLFYTVALTIYGIIMGMLKLNLGVLSTWTDVVKVFYNAPNLWWHKCLSQTGNDNQMALLRQSLFMKDAGEGNGMGNYSNSVVSDGLMFKKTVLTPEEILGRKTQSMQATSRQGVANQDAGVSIFSDQLNNDDPTRASKASALLPGSTNRASQKRKAKLARTSVAPAKGGKGGKDKDDDKDAQAAGSRQPFGNRSKSSRNMSMKVPTRSADSTASMAHGLGVDKAHDSKASLAQFFNKNATKAQSMRVRTAGPEASETEVDDGFREPEAPQARGLFKRLGQTFKGGASPDKTDAMMGQYQKSAAKRLEAKEAALAAKEAAARDAAQQAAVQRKRAQSAAPGRVQPSMPSHSGMSVSGREMSTVAPLGQSSEPGAGAGPGAGGEGGLKRMMTGFKRIMTAGRADNSLMAAADRALAAEGGMSMGMGRARATTAGPGASHFLAAEHAPAGRPDREGRDPIRRPEMEGIQELQTSRPASSAAPSRPASRPASGVGSRPSSSVAARPSGSSRPVAEGNEIEEVWSEEEEEEDLSPTWMPPLPPVAPRPPAPAPPPVAEDALIPASPMAPNSGGEAPRASASLVSDTPVKKAPEGQGGVEVTHPTSVSDHYKQVEEELDEVFGAPLDAAQVRHLPHNSVPVSDAPEPEAETATPAPAPRVSAVGTPPRSSPALGLGSPVRSPAKAMQSKDHLVLEHERSSAGASRYSSHSAGIGSGGQARLPTEVMGSHGGDGEEAPPHRQGSSSSTASSNGVRARSQLPLMATDKERSDDVEGNVPPGSHGATGHRESHSSTSSSQHLVVGGSGRSHGSSSGRYGTPLLKPGEKRSSEDPEEEEEEEASGPQKPAGGVAIAMMVEDDEDSNPSAILHDERPVHKEEPKKGGFFGRLFGGDDGSGKKKKFLRALDASVMPANDHQAGGPGVNPAHGGPPGMFRSSMSQPNVVKGGKQAWGHELADHHYGKVPLRNPSMLLMGQEEEIPEEEIDDVHYQMMMWNAFASAWDDIVDDLNHGDIISEKEVSMLKFVRLDLGSRSHGLRPILLPTFFYAGQIRKVVDTGQVSVPQVMVLSELRMLCVWLGCQIGLLSGKHAHVINDTPFISKIVNVKHALYRKKFYMAGIKLVDLMENMCQLQEVPFDMREFADQLLIILNSLEGEAYAIIKNQQGKPEGRHDIDTASILLEVVQSLKREVASDPNKLKVIFKNALLTSATANYKELLKVIRVLKRMLRATVAEATPDSEEAQRVLGFFVNSLSHPSMDKPPSVDRMPSHSVITPLYEEDVLYPLEAGSLAKELNLKKKNMTDLLSETDDSISLMAYLKAMFPGEWNNFKERMKTLVPDIKVDELSEQDFAAGRYMHELRLELQFWASLRGQLLARTVNGMMRYEKALRLLAKMEHPRPPTMSQADHDKYIDQIIAYKFEYVVTAQTYGKLRDSNDLRLRWLAKAIDTLLQRYGRLKAAFLDTAPTDSGPTQFSVCIKGRIPDSIEPIPVHVVDEDQPVFELYRVRLPLNRYSGRGVILGEGKPENQNHACIFAHNECMQAIDMNQDNYLTESFKMRNLLMELTPSIKPYKEWEALSDESEDFKYLPTTTAAEVMDLVAWRYSKQTTAILVGFREYIFSEAAGALGKFAAATEYAFGTITQRIMTYPANVRLHYGHPDVFNKLWTMSRGGISKATRLLHLTEDVFCGCNHVLRGGKVRYKEYINCGKGRDMGFDSINGFNFKVSGGGGEWGISRESWRMGTRLDFFRLMSFYHSAVGFYINSWLTYCGVYFNIYALLLFAWAEATEVGSDGQKVYNVQQILQLGTLALVPYAGQLMLEMGVIKMAILLFQQIMTGSLLFYMFQQMTVACSFSADMSYGSGKYVGTGRGFNITTMEFVKVFTLYCRSHLYMGFELFFILITLYIVKDCQSCDYGSFTWSTWLLAFTLIIAPMWFNPFAFDMDKVNKNFIAWRQWMEGDIDHTTGSNWYTWNTSTLEKIRNDNGNNTDQWMNNVFIFISCTPFFLMALSSASRLENIKLKSLDNGHPLANGWIIFLLGTAATAFVVGASVVLRQHWLDLARHRPWRLFRWVLTLGLMVFFILFLVVVGEYYDGGAKNGFATIMIILYANINLMVAFHRFATAAWSQNSYLRAFCDIGYYTLDTFIGYTLFIILGLLAFLGLPGILQMKLLFNDAFSKTANYGKIAKAMKDAKIGSTGQAHAIPMISRPGSAQSGATAITDTKSSKSFDVRSMVRSEHRYL